VTVFSVRADGATTVAQTLTVSAGGIAVTGNSTITGTLGVTGATTLGTTTAGGTGTLLNPLIGTAGVDVAFLLNHTGAGFVAGTDLLLQVQEGGVTVFSVRADGATTVAQTLTVSAGGIAVTGNSTITGTLGGLTGLTVASGGATITGASTITGTLGGLTGLTVASGGATITGASTITGNLTLAAAGNKLLITEGANATVGTAVGAVSTNPITVATTAVTANSRIFMTFDTTLDVACAAALDFANPFVSARAAGVSFDVSVSQLTLGSRICVQWWIIN